MPRFLFNRTLPLQNMHTMSDTTSATLFAQCVGPEDGLYKEIHLIDTTAGSILEIINSPFSARKIGRGFIFFSLHLDLIVGLKLSPGWNLGAP